MRLPLPHEGPISASATGEDILALISEARSAMGGDKATLYPRVWATIVPRVNKYDEDNEVQQPTPRSQLLAKRTASYEGGAISLLKHLPVAANKCCGTCRCRGGGDRSLYCWCRRWRPDARLHCHAGTAGPPRPARITRRR